MHDQVRPALELARLVQRDDVGVVQPGDGAGFAREARPALFVAAEVDARHLSATLRSSLESCTRYTSPMPPPPSEARIL